MHIPLAKSCVATLPFLFPTFAIILQPLGVNHYEAAFGIQRRSNSRDFDVEPKTQVELFYGQGNDDGTLAVANVTLDAPSGLPIVLLERFEPLTKYVDCNGDDGHMSLTFKSEDAFRRALNAWSFINNGIQRFMVIANHDGCGPKYQRQSYIVSKVTEDPELLTTHLASEPVEWSQIATDYKLSFGHYEPNQPSIRGRQVENNAARTLLRKRAGKPYTASFTVNAGAAGKKNIFNDGSKRMKVDCTDCFAKGKVRATFNYEVKGTNIVALTLSLSPQDLSVSGKLSTTFSSKNLVEKLGKNIDLVQGNIPGTGVTLLGVVSVGLTATYQVGITGTFKGSGSWDTQLEASVPGKSLITVDALRPERSKIEGWNLQVNPPVYSIPKLENEASFSIQSQPKLSFGAQVKNGPKLTVAISIPLPAAEVKMTPTKKASGEVCPGSGSNSGVVIKTSLSSGVKGSVELPGKGSVENDIGAKWEKVLAAQCVPLKVISQSKAEDKSTSSTLENQGIQVATNQLGKVIGGLSNAGGGSETTTTSQTSGTFSQNEDINQILDDTFGGYESSTDTTSADDDISQILDDTFGDLDGASDTSTVTADTSGTTTATDDDDVNQILDDTFGATEGDQATITSTEGDQTTTTTDDEVNQALDDTFGISQDDLNPAITTEADQPITTGIDEDVNQALEDAFGTTEDDQTAISNTEGDQTIATAIDDDQITSSPEDTSPSDFAVEDINTDPSSIPSEDEINSALGEIFNEDDPANSSSGGGEIAASTDSGDNLSFDSGSGDFFNDLG